MFDEKLRPIPNPQADYTSLPFMPTPEEFFLLSRITGSVTVGELCSISGQSHDATMKALARLDEAGLIMMPRPGGPAVPNFGAERARSSPPAADAASSSRPSSPAADAAALPPPAAAALAEDSSARDEREFPGWPITPARFSYEGMSAALTESCDLDDATRRELLFVHEHIDRIDYYLFLGVAREADRKEVRDAYFKLSKRYHPDLYFGRELGSFKGRIDIIFQRLNKINQVLGHKQKRADYDQTLLTQANASAPSSPIPSASSSPSQMRRASSVAADVAQSSPADASSSPSIVGAHHPELDERKREITFNTLLKRAEKHEAAGDYQAAAEEYRRAFAIKHEAAVALRGANLMMRCGEAFLDDAIALAKAAAKEEPHNGKPLLLLGDAYEEKGDLGAARRYYEEAQRLEPENKIVARRLKYLNAAGQ